MVPLSYSLTFFSMPDGSPRSEVQNVAPVERLKPRQESLPKRGEPYAFELDRSVSAVEALLERSQVQADKREEFRALADTWRKRSQRDSQAAGKEMTADIYALAIRNFTRKLEAATTPDERHKAQHGVDYYTESLRLRNEVEAKKAELAKGSPDGNSNLYRAYAEHPEAVHAFYFTKALEIWKLPPGVKEYGEAALARERSREAYINAQHDWFGKNCGEAYTELMTRKRAWEKDVDGVESWEVTSSFHIKDDHEESSRHKVEGSRRLSRASQAFIDPQAKQEREETFRELYADLYEAQARADAALIAARESAAERIAKNPALAKQLVDVDSRGYYWHDNAFALSGEKFVESVLPDGLGFSLGRLLTELDPELGKAIGEARQTRNVIYEARRRMVDQMYDVLREEKKNMEFAAAKLQEFKPEEREQALAPLKRQLLQSEQRVAAAVQGSGQDVNYFLTRVASATYYYSQVGSDRYMAGKTTKRVIEDLKSTEGYRPEYQRVHADTQIRQQQTFLEKQGRLQRQTMDVLARAKKVNLNNIQYDSKEVMEAVQKSLLGDQANDRPPEHLDPLPYSGVSIAYESPLAEAVDISQFAQSVSYLEERGLNASLVEGGRACARPLKELADRLTGSSEYEIRRLGWALESKYASVLKLI
jgi:hypothetical protein